MATQIDYMIAAGIFILIIGFVLHFTTGYLADMRTSMSVTDLRSGALSLLSVSSRDFETFNGETKRIGLASDAYRFWILMNNTKQNLVNTSMDAQNLENETIQFNYSQMGFGGIDYNSTVIYENGTVEIQRQLDRESVTFKANIGINESKWFLVYFDENSNFTMSTQTISGTNSVREKFFPAHKVSVVQYRKIQQLTSMDYEHLRNTTGIENFRITISDLSDSQNIADYGGSLPKEGNIVSLGRRIVFQNQSGSIRNGNLVIRVW